MSVVDREALRERRAQIGPLIEPIDGVPYGTMVSTDDPLVVAVDAVLEGEATWRCAAHGADFLETNPDQHAMCMAMLHENAWDTLPEPESCRRVRVVVVPIGGE